ncbi:hypothetical protein HYS50_00290 [Candidatus Woesearchaeota archaeon]|nr:hypothetical protein [Candidatus Woesearchaeota archaeon]
MVNIELLLDLVTPDKIDLSDYESVHGMVLANGLIMVNQRLSQEEQIKTILHEVIHTAPAFRQYTEGLWAGKRRRDEAIEERIEAEAQYIYQTRPDIVRIVEERLREAYQHPANKRK